MGIPTTIGRFAVKEQAAGWGTPETVFANANFVEAQIVIPTPTQETVQAEVMRASFFATSRLAGGKGPTELSLTMPLHGFSTADPTVDPTETPDSLLLRSVLGAAAQDGFADDPGGGANNTLIVGAAQNIPGFAVMAPMGGTSPTEYSVGWVKDLNVLTYTMQHKWALDSAGGEQTPDSSGTVFGGNSIYLTATQPTAFTLEWLGSTANVNYRFYDCVVTSATITLNAREQPTLAVTIRAANWTNSATGGAPSEAALANRPQMPVVLSDNGARVVDASAEQKAGSVSIAMTSTVADEINYDAPQGVARFVVTKRVVETTIVSPAAATSASNLDNPASLLAPGASGGAFQIDAGTTPGRAFSALIPSGQVKELQALGDANSLVSVTTVLECAIYSGDTATTGSLGAPANTPFRLAFL